MREWERLCERVGEIETQTDRQTDRQTDGQRERGRDGRAYDELVEVSKEQIRGLVKIHT